MDKKEVVMFVIILGLLLGVAIVSGFFYMMIAKGLIVTSHVVSADDSQETLSGNLADSQNQDKDVMIKHEDLTK